MPELPEVETVCRGLEPLMKGQVVKEVTLRRKDLRIPFPKNMASRLEGCKILRVSRRAKYILIHTAKAAHGDGGEILVVHLGMSGQMMLIDKSAPYHPRKHDHMVISLANGAMVVFHDPRRFGMVMMEPADKLAAHTSFKNLGPEPLENSFTGAVLQKRLAGKTAPIKTALLDQHVVAGVGNIYACEALYQAGLSPFAPCGSLSLKQVNHLVGAIKDVLQRAIKAGGSTLKDYKKADGSLGYFQHSFAVYGRGGDACPKATKGGKTNHLILKTTQSGRATYHCPHCQKG